MNISFGFLWRVANVGFVHCWRISLKREIKCGDSKNAALAILAASSLAEQGESFSASVINKRDFEGMGIKDGKLV